MTELPADGSKILIMTNVIAPSRTRANAIFNPEKFLSILFNMQSIFMTGSLQYT